MPAFAVISEPIDLSEATALASGGGFTDLDAHEMLLQYVPIGQPPFFLAGVGLVISLLCGLTFSKLVQNRLDGWKQDRLALLPLGTAETVASYTGIILGVSLFIGGSLQVFGFGGGTALLVAFLLSLLTAGGLWIQLERLMGQVQDGSFKAVDFDNFDQFF
ncbi:hypothetical protein [Synechococcus sp. CS-603]|uniref:hypothetical protein n=1 Tax=Synechococcus sp. CS-603 TaxID=2847981 RepID=UPI00223BDBE9|nr:hypothetical protein [Synechococcus sp. CS-603]MCT0202750.1 hypothetical protein [Synechococcus sp. CS-603]MCT4363688.1 hypothetical protein [Candidatus Regnicoccus frigidus MAG-AL1]